MNVFKVNKEIIYECIQGEYRNNLWMYSRWIKKEHMNVFKVNKEIIYECIQGE